MPSRLISQRINVSNSISKLSAMDEVVFIHLIVSCDDYGRFYGLASIVKGMLFSRREFNEAQVELALQRLEEMGMIRRYDCDGTVYLELTSWMKYQTPRAKESKFPSPEDESCTLHQVAVADGCEQMQTKASKPKQQKEPDECAQRFEEFWKEYPNKKAKPVALKSFQKINPDADLFERMMAGLRKQKQSYGWKKDNGQFIPHPATWLNQRRWEDVVEDPRVYVPNHEVGSSSGNPFRRSE